MRFVTSPIDLIGNTPLIDLSKLCGTKGRVLAKAEFMNPGGSIKDRAALAIIQATRSGGLLAEGQSVVEMTSGNMGAGLALVCRHFGHPFVAVMSEGNSQARAKIMEAFGAEVVLVPQVEGSPGQVTGEDIRHAQVMAKEIAARRGGYYVDQFANPGSVAAHRNGTGPEILAMAPSVDLFVSVVGSGGTFIGVAQCLKARNPGTRCVAVEPAGAAVLAGERVRKPNHVLQGTGYGFVPPHWQPELADGFRTVTDDEATEWRSRLAHAGYYVGFSSAANVAATAAVMNSGLFGENATAVTILCDSGFKY